MTPVYVELKLQVHQKSKGQSSAYFENKYYIVLQENK